MSSIIYKILQLGIYFINMKSLIIDFNNQHILEWTLRNTNVYELIKTFKVE